MASSHRRYSHIIAGHPHLELGLAVPLHPRQAIVLRRDCLVKDPQMRKSLLEHAFGEMVRLEAENVHCAIHTQRSRAKAPIVSKQRYSQPTKAEGLRKILTG